MGSTAVPDYSRKRTSTDYPASRAAFKNQRNQTAHLCLHKLVVTMITDAVVILITAAVTLSGWAWLKSGTGHMGLPAHHSAITAADVLPVFGFIIAFVGVSWRHPGYTTSPRPEHGRELLFLLHAASIAGLVDCGTLYLTHRSDVSPILIGLFASLVTAALFLCRLVERSAILRLGANQSDLQNLLIAGTGHLSRAIGDYISCNPRFGYRLHGFVALSPADAFVSLQGHEIASLDRLHQTARAGFIDEIIIGDSCDPQQIALLLRAAHELGIAVRAVSCFHADLAAGAPFEYLGMYPVTSLLNRRVRTVSTILKRLIDLLVSSVMLIATIPIMCVTACAIKIDSPGPVFYVAERIGRRGRPFHCFKFRSMVTNADDLRGQLLEHNERDGILFKLSNDPRVTRVGAFIRKFSLDELPQLFNVLRGEMSIVGPRPPTRPEVEKYDPDHLRRLEVLPGLTGLWQIRARQDSSFANYIALDMTYIDEWSLWLDLKIMLSTFGAVMRGTGC
jgi:exopolysaccharide biosynthesis polyprenyl glycosylphosphotransferase